MNQFKIHVIDVKNSLQNYIWVIEDIDQQEIIMVDPTDAECVTAFCTQQQLKLKQIWLTHWHKDHIGGVPALISQGQIPVYGPRDELSKIPFITHPLQHDDPFEFNGLKVEVLGVPGHTLGHIAYYLAAIDAVFCGDTLFAMGCGRLFEGTPEQMYHSLNRLAALAPSTRVYCTHEYTQANGLFALTIEPDNKALQQRMHQVNAQRAAGEITLPSTIELELQTNPFLRVNSAAELKKIRELKDQF